MCLFVIRKVGQRKTLSSRRKIWLSFSGKCFPSIFDGKYFLEVVKKLEKSYYLLIISNLILKLLIDIYILFLFIFFQFHHLELIFILILVFIFIIIICFFLIIFLIEIFNLSNLVLILLIVTYFI